MIRQVGYTGVTNSTRFRVRATDRRRHNGVAEGSAQAVPGIATDFAGNAATTERVVNIDKTPPEIFVVQSPPPIEAGWNNTDVTVTFDCEDALSGSSVGLVHRYGRTINLEWPGDGADEGQMGNVRSLKSTIQESRVCHAWVATERRFPAHGHDHLRRARAPPTHRCVHRLRSFQITDMQKKVQ